MAARIRSGVASGVTGFGESGGDGYLGRWVGFVWDDSEGDPPDEDIGTEKLGVEVDVG